MRWVLGWEKVSLAIWLPTKSVLLVHSRELFCWTGIYLSGIYPYSGGPQATRWYGNVLEAGRYCCRCMVELWAVGKKGRGKNSGIWVE